MFRFNIIAFIILAVMIASALGYFVVSNLRHEFAKEEKVAEVEPPTVGGSTSDSESIPSPFPTLFIPDLNRPIIFSVNLPDETKKDAEARIKSVSAKLKENPALYSQWVELGLYRKLIGDYVGAAIAWEHAGVLNPTSFIPSQNLGDLYALDIKDYQKAEAYYKKSISKDEKVIMVYEKLYELYKYYLKDPSRAKAVLEDGIAKNPQTSERLRWLLTNN